MSINIYSHIPGDSSIRKTVKVKVRIMSSPGLKQTKRNTHITVSRWKAMGDHYPRGQQVKAQLNRFKLSYRAVVINISSSEKKIKINYMLKFL